MGRGATHDRGRVADGRRRQHREGDARLCRRAAALRPGGRGRGPRDEPQLCGDRPRAARRDRRLYQHRGRQGDDLPADGGAGHRPGRAPAWGNHALHDRRGPAQRSRRRAGPVTAPPRATGRSQAARRRAPPAATRLRVRAGPAAGRGALVRGCRGPHPRRHSPPYADRYGSLPGGDLLLSAGRSIGDRPPPGRPDGDPSHGRSAGNAMARGAPRLLGQSAAASPGHYRSPPGALQPRSSIDVASGTRRRAGGGGRAAMKCDLAVVGSGLAALVATRTLQQAGRNTVLIWPGLSSLYFTYATVDVLGYSDLTTTQTVEQPEAGVAKLIADHPNHPYSLAGLDALRSGTTLLIEWLRAAGFTWQGSLARNLLLPTAIGTPKPSCLVPASMAAGDLRRTEPIVFCGFHGYEDFVPELAASNLSRSWGGDDQSVRAIRVSLPGFEPGRLFTSIDIARSFQDAAFRREVAGRIRREAAVDGIRIGMPAVLGLTHDMEVYSSFAAEVGQPVFEIPTLPPSVLGLRLFDRLRKHIQESGVEMVWAAPAHAAELSDGQCRRILLKSAGREQPIDARAYVLALEDTVDGALRAGVHSVVDPFFHQSLAHHAVPTDRTDESLFKPQPFASVGYRVSNRLQPIGDDGRPLAGNVFVAGGAMPGYGPGGSESPGGVGGAPRDSAARGAGGPPSH